MSSSDTPASRPSAWLLACVDDGRTGRLSITTTDGRFDAYFTGGELLAVEASDDGARMVELLQHRGAVRADVDRIARRIAEGASMSQGLSEVLADTDAMPLLRERFRENLVRALARGQSCSFEPMEAVFADNIQVGHDTRSLIEELDGVAQRVCGFDGLLDHVVRRVREVASDHPLADIVAQCDGTRTVRTLLRRTAREPSRVAVALRQLLDDGCVGVEPAPRLGAPRTAPAVSAPAPVELGHDDELAAFQDYDSVRAGGDFTTDRSLLDRVEVTDGERSVGSRGEPSPETVLEMEEADRASAASAPGSRGGADGSAAPVSLNLSGPRLHDHEARHKLTVVDDVFAVLSVALDGEHGHGAGSSRVQLLLEGSPSGYLPLFKNVEVGRDGRMPLDLVLKNLRKRPAAEQRRLLDRALADLIERALGAAGEALPDESMDRMLEQIAGYQQRLGK